MDCMQGLCKEKPHVPWKPTQPKAEATTTLSPGNWNIIRGRAYLGWRPSQLKAIHVQGKSIKIVAVSGTADTPRLPGRSPFAK